jgi:hypothetical protein
MKDLIKNIGFVVFILVLFLPFLIRFIILPIIELKKWHDNAKEIYGRKKK